MGILPNGRQPTLKPLSALRLASKGNRRNALTMEFTISSTRSVLKNPKIDSSTFAGKIFWIEIIETYFFWIQYSNQHELIECLNDVVTKSAPAKKIPQCTEKTAKLFAEFLDSVQGNLINTLCGEYSNESDICNGFSVKKPKTKSSIYKSFVLPLIKSLGSSDVKLSKWSIIHSNTQSTTKYESIYQIKIKHVSFWLFAFLPLWGRSWCWLLVLLHVPSPLPVWQLNWLSFPWLQQQFHSFLF